MSLHSKQSLHERLSDPTFRRAFISSRIGQTIAAQVRVLRQRREMSQKDLARHLGTSQNAIYRLENPRYDRHSVSTLKKIDEFFDVGLSVRFASFSEIAAWAIGMSDQAIDIPDFDRDTGFTERKPQGSVGMMPRIAQPSLEDAQRREDNVIVMRRGAQALTQQPSEALVGCAGVQR